MSKPQQAKQLQIDKELIRTRKERLERVRAELKQEFVGIHHIIDELIGYLQIWYLMPEILARPIIINLWGMTGVGKTDLVRKLVKKLEYQDRFAEVELTNSDNSSYYGWHSSVAAILETNGVDDGKPAIVLFDEIQRFNTLDKEGTPIQNDRFQDFWELLSDGRLARRDSKEDITTYLNNYLYSSSQRRKQTPPPAVPTPESELPTPETVGIWDANRLKKLFSLEEEVADIASLTQEEVLQKMLRHRKQKRIFEAVDYSKTLIIISGNLDDAFDMARATSEADVDADIFHAYTKKITLVDIKNSLASRFKPEQVARFGNIHLIYHSLRRADFEQLIALELDKIRARNLEHFGITLEIAPRVHTLVYQNGVFPVQGVRPVFSSITDIIEANLSRFVFEALMNDSHHIALDYDFTTKELIAEIEGVRQVRLPYEGRIDRIRQGNEPSVTACVSVHEAGHAVIYAALFGLAPLQLKSRVASAHAGGFTFPHQIFLTKETLLHKIKVFLAGGLAEELVFGASNASLGREQDREQATALACDYVRKHGFHADYQAFYSDSPHHPLDTDPTDGAVETMLRQLVTETTALLQQHRALLLRLAATLQTHGSLTAQQIADLAQQAGVPLSIQPESHQHTPAYDQWLKHQTDSHDLSA